MDSDKSTGVIAARLEFVKSRIHPEIEDTDNEIKHLQLLIDMMMNGKMNLKIKHLQLVIDILNGKMKLLTLHRKTFQNLEHLVMTRGDFTPKDMPTEKIKIDDDDDDDDDDDGDERSRRLKRMVSSLNKHRKLLRLTTTTPEVKVEHLKGEMEYNIS